MSAYVYIPKRVHKTRHVIQNDCATIADSELISPFKISHAREQSA